MADQDKVIDGEELLEFKADGEESSVADPVSKGSTKRKADKDQGDKAPLSMDTKDGPKMSKAKMISAMVSKQYEDMSKMTASDLRDMYDAQTNASGGRKADKSGNGMSMMKLSVKEDVAEIFGGQDLGEEFIERAETIFEAAVAAKITTEIARLEEEYETKLEEAAVEQAEALLSHVDEYLSYAVNEWVEENRLAIEAGVRADIAESFMQGMKEVFEEHYIDIPDEKVDVVAELSAKIEELETGLNEQIEENMNLKNEKIEMEMQSVFEEVSADLASTQAEKLRKLSEGIDADTVELYKEKLIVVRENYFPSDKPVVAEASEQLDVADEEEQQLQEAHGEMAAYLQAISKSIKN